MNEFTNLSSTEEVETSEIAAAECDVTRLNIAKTLNTKSAFPPETFYL